MLLHGGLIGASGVAVGAGSSPAFDLTAGGITFAYVSDSGTNTTISGNVPANVVDGNLMLAFALSGAPDNPASITNPAGWTSIILETGVDGLYFRPYSLSYRVANSEPSSYSWTVTSGATDDAVAIIRVTGANTSSPISGTPVVDHHLTTTPTSPSVTTAHANALGVFGFCVHDGWSLNAEDAGYPSGTSGVFARRSRQYSGGVVFALATQAITSAGATGSKVWGALTESTESDEFSFAIRPA
jgi:hypothetical protein